MRFPRPMLFITLALFACAPANLLAEKYPIKLDRPRSAGQKYEIKAAVTDQRTTTVKAPGAARPPQSVTLAYRIEAVVEVLEVDTDGGQTKVKLTIGKLTELGEGIDEALASEGDVFIGEMKNDKPAFSKEGGTIKPDAARALSQLVSLRRSDVPSTDEVFPTDKKHDVGDTWPLDVDAATKGLKKMGIPAEKKDVSGQAKIVAAKEVDGVECLEIELDMTVKGLSPPEGKLPAGSKIKESTVRLVGTMMLPKNVTRFEQADQSEMTTTVVIGAQLPNNAGEAEIHQTMVRRRTATFKQLK